MSTTNEKLNLVNGKQASNVFAVLGTAIFLGCPVALFFLSKNDPVSEAIFEMFRTWSLGMICFSSGIRWGLILVEKTDVAFRLAITVLFPLLGWIALLIPGPYSILMLLFVYSLRAFIDYLPSSLRITPSYFRNTRTMFNLLAIFAHVATFIAVF